MKRMRTAGAGVTLIELLVVLGLLAILAALAAPALGQMVLNQRQSTAARDIWLALALTRSEAIRQGRRMVLCRSPTAAAARQLAIGRKAGSCLPTPTTMHNAMRVKRCCRSGPRSRQACGCEATPRSCATFLTCLRGIPNWSAAPFRPAPSPSAVPAPVRARRSRS